MTKKTISINRAPVLTLWATVVAERLGFERDEALSLGKGVAGLNDKAKGRRLDIFKPHEEQPTKVRQTERGKEFCVEICGRPVPARNTDDGIRAVSGNEEIDPQGVQRYLAREFGESLDEVWQAMTKLAKAYEPKELAGAAFPLYEHFRPEIPQGVEGWSAKGDLDLGRFESLFKAKQP